MNSKLREIDPPQAFEEQGNGTVLLDVREADEFKAGHAAGAISIPLSELKDRIEELDKDKALNIICKSGGRSTQAAMALNSIGFNATNVSGGSLQWQANNLPFISEDGSTPVVI